MKKIEPGEDFGEFFYWAMIDAAKGLKNKKVEIIINEEGCKQLEAELNHAKDNKAVD